MKERKKERKGFFYHDLIPKRINGGGTRKWRNLWIQQLLLLLLQLVLSCVSVKVYTTFPEREMNGMNNLFQS